MKHDRQRFLQEQNGLVKAIITTDLSGKTVLVVDANTGLGREAASHMASMNAALVILGCRSLVKGNAASEGILTHPGQS